MENDDRKCDTAPDQRNGTAVVTFLAVGVPSNRSQRTELPALGHSYGG